MANPQGWEIHFVKNIADKEMISRLSNYFLKCHKSQSA
jgi:hypothetical protein